MQITDIEKVDDKVYMITPEYETIKRESILLEECIVVGKKIIFKFSNNNHNFIIDREDISSEKLADFIRLAELA